MLKLLTILSIIVIRACNNILQPKLSCVSDLSASLTTDSMSSTTGIFDFFALPYEIREGVYKLIYEAFPAGKIVQCASSLHPYTCEFSEQQGHCLDLRHFTVSKAFYTEATEIFFSRSVFKYTKTPVSDDADVTYKILMSKSTVNIHARPNFLRPRFRNLVRTLWFQTHFLSMVYPSLGWPNLQNVVFEEDLCHLLRLNVVIHKVDNDATCAFIINHEQAAFYFRGPWFARSSRNQARDQLTHNAIAISVKITADMDSFDSLSEEPRVVNRLHLFRKLQGET